MHRWLLDGVHAGWGPNITITNPAIGGHVLSYVVANGACYDTVSYFIQILGAPVAGFDINSNSCSNTIMVSNKSKNANHYTWNFGDGATLADSATGANATYTYPANGTYTIQLIAKDLFGCADTAEMPITVNRAFNHHLANFTFDNSLCNCRCQNQVRFQNLTPGNNNTFLWTFGDGSTSVQKSPSKGFGEAGNYQVTLTAIDSIGCMSSLTKVITIVPGVEGPSANFNTDYQVQCLDDNNFNFYNTSKYMGGGWIKKYYWNFGDGTIDTTNTFVYNKKYTVAGNYVVSLIAEGAEGCRDTMTMYIQVRPNPCTGVLKYVNLADGSNWNITPGYGGGEIAAGMSKLNKEMEMGLYPNPNDGSFALQFSEVINGAFTLEIRDMTGRLVFEQAEIGDRSKEVKVISTGLSEGTYFVRLITEEGTTLEKKFVVVK